MEASKSRIWWKDSASCITLFLIQLGHLGNTGVGLVRPWMQWYANPIFFIISGLLAEKNTNISLYLYCKKSFKRLIVPYAVWSILNSLYYMYTLNEINRELCFRLFHSFIAANVNGGYIIGGTCWFLLGIFIAKVVWYSMYKYFGSKYKVTVACFFVWMIFDVLRHYDYPVMDYGYTRGLYWLFFYSLGPMLVEHFENNSNRIWSEPHVLKFRNVSYLIVLTVFSFYICSFGGDYVIRELLPYGYMLFDLVVEIVIPLLLSVCTLELCLFIKNSNIIFLGKNSLFLCGCESIVKLSVLYTFSAIGLKFDLSCPFYCLVYIIICFYVYFYLLKVFEVALPNFLKHILY